MRLTKYFLPLILLVPLSGLAAGRTPEETARAIVASSPRVKSLDASLAAESAKGMTEANLPDPEVEGEFLAAPAGEQNRWGAGISWGLDWPGAYSARKGLAKAEAEAAAWRNRAELRDLEISARRAILDYILQTKQIEAVKRLILTTDSVALLAEKAGRGGEMTRLDLNKLKLENASLSTRLSGLLDTRTQSIATLSAIAGKDCAPILQEMETEFPATTDFTEQQLAAMIGTSPQMAEAEAALKVADEERKVASREALPGITIGYRHAFEDGNHFNGGTLGLSIPLFSSKGKMKAAKAARLAAEANAEEVRTTGTAEAAASLTRLRLLNEEIAKTAPLLDTTDNQALLLKAYKAGVITLIDYLNERNYFLEASMQLLEMRHAGANALLDIIALGGM